MKVVTWNINSVRARLDHVKLLIEKQNPDVICLQETKVTDDLFPLSEFDGYDTACYGQKSYNGVSIHTKKRNKNPLEDVEVIDFDYGTPEARIIAGTYRKIRFINVYVPVGFADMGAYNKKLSWLKELSELVEDSIRIFKHVVLLGDFNIAPTTKDSLAPNDSICCTAREREAFSDFLANGMNCLWDYKSKRKKFSWYDYRFDSFNRNVGMRLDHILVSDSLTRYVKSYRNLRGYRKLEKPSDHLPVIMEIGNENSRR